MVPPNWSWPEAIKPKEPRFKFSNHLGTKIREWPLINNSNYDDHKNGQWVIASVGLGRSGKEEYAIINRASNTFLIAPGM